MLDGVLASHAHASARRPPSTKTPGKVSVDKHTERGPFILPRETVNAPGPDHQVANQAGQGRPVCGQGGRHPPAALLSCKAQVRAIHAKVIRPRRQRPKTQACSRAEWLR
eukprot:10171997-Alexandrium_andersonii.AAC.1